MGIAACCGFVIRAYASCGFNFCAWPIVLKNSKIAGLRKSRECSALAISTAARLRRIDTSASDRFCGNVISGLVEAADQTLPLRQKTSADNACSIRLRQPRVDLFPQQTDVGPF